MLAMAREMDAFRKDISSKRRGPNPNNDSLIRKRCRERRMESLICRSLLSYEGITLRVRVPLFASEDMTRCMRDVRMELSASRKTHEKTSEAALSAVERSKSELMEAIKQDRQRLGANLERIVKDSKADLDDVVKMIKESMIASCSHIITATKDRASSDLGEAIAVLQESRGADMSQVIRNKQ